MLDAVRLLLPSTQRLDIASGYFEVGSLLDLDGDWQTVRKIRLLMGDEVTKRTKSAMVEALREKDKNGIERQQEEDDWRALEGLAAIKAGIIADAIETRVYTKAKFHAKAMHFHTTGVVNHGLVGSSNFTRPGLTQNIELNLFTSDPAHLALLEEWFQRSWDEAEDLKAELLAIIEPHVREYFPFEVYVKAMRERFHGMEADGTSWEATESRVYPVLAKYQRDAYFDLKYMGEKWGGGLLCDGVGLGKTHVGLMLIEQAISNREKVLVIAPKAAIPSVWERNLKRFFPDDFGKFTDDIRILAHTDLGREGGVTDEQIEKLRSRYQMIIIDEAHHFRNTHRNRSKKLKALTKGRKTFLLTATPINNSLLDLYVLINYIAQDRKDHFQEKGVANLRGWFAAHMGEIDQERLKLDLSGESTFHEFLKHILVQRSRVYVKSLEKDIDETIKFPQRQLPVVIEYSLGEVYGDLLPELFNALHPQKPELNLVIYETEKFKKEENQDKDTLDFQSNVTSLIRTMLLKRLESSEKALEASVESLLWKHVALIQELRPLKHEAWIAENLDLFERMKAHREDQPSRDDDEEEDELPLTSYELKKLEEIKEDIKLFGKHEEEWVDTLERDMRTLSRILSHLHDAIHPENDAKLQAFIKKIKATPRLMTDKFVVFTEFKDTARYLEEQLKLAFPDEAIVEVDSGRHVSDREKVIKRFAPYYNCDSDDELSQALEDPIRILVSTDVLSEGLNLQDANIIVNYDLHWNPVRLMQRIGRVDRRMDPDIPVDYDKVYVYNFLPPDELERLIGLHHRLTGKLAQINRALGIEAPVLDPTDETQVVDFYLNLGEGKMSVAETLRREAAKLERDHPEIWSKAADYPNRIYTGKPGEKRYLFLCYRVVAGFEPDAEEKTPVYDTKWYMVDRKTGDVTEDMAKIHEVIQCAEGTPRDLNVPKEERTKLRKSVEEGDIAKHRFTAQIPQGYKDKLVCWMEI